MALQIYKYGQGKWTRLLTAAGVGIIALDGVRWIWQEMDNITDEATRFYAQTGMFFAVVLGVGGLLFWLLNKPRIADFMIATEGEMKKVNWPTRREIVGSTWIVICGTLMLAAFLWVVDLGFTEFFLNIRIIEGRSLLGQLFGGQ
ncbi:MAG: preprotein translocase subunit SecE [Phycisphaeraceae bacterium]|nr:preprotein translocase subunit SecE [Phycisphaeraceae bacterium]